MNFIISGKNIEVTPGLKDSVISKLGKLERYFTPDTEIIVTDHGWTWVTALCVMIFSLMHFPCGTTYLTQKLS